MKLSELNKEYSNRIEEVFLLKELVDCMERENNPRLYIYKKWLRNFQRSARQLDIKRHKMIVEMSKKIVEKFQLIKEDEK